MLPTDGPWKTQRNECGCKETQVQGDQRAPSKQAKVSSSGNFWHVLHPWTVPYQ